MVSISLAPLIIDTIVLPLQHAIRGGSGTRQMGYYWPNLSFRGREFASLVSAYKAVGFEECERPDKYIEGIDVVALFHMDGNWAHACRLCEDGRWCSKYNIFEDFMHTLAEMHPIYGAPRAFMSRPYPYEDPR